MRVITFSIIGILYVLFTGMAFADVEIINSRAAPSSFRGAAITALNKVDGEGTTLKRVARFTYDVDADGGDVATHQLGASLPANAIITRSYFRIDTQFTDAGSGTVGLYCEDVGNIYVAADITGNAVTTLVEGVSTGAASAFQQGIAADCIITAVVAGSAQTAGKLTGWVEYVVHD